MKNPNKIRRALLVAGFAATSILTFGLPALSGADDLQANKDVAIALSTAIRDGDWAKAGSLISDDFTYIGDGQAPLDKAGYLGFMRGVLTAAFTDMDMQFLRVIAEGDLVAIDYTNAMTNSGDFFGIPATGKRVFATGQFIREVKNGKVTAEWQTTNGVGLMAQLTGG